MRIILRLFLALVACFCLVTAARGVYAGNYTNTAALYFSVELTPGQYLYSADGRIILIDDITYSVQFVPCDPLAACEFFDADDILPVQPQSQGISAPTYGSLAVWRSVTGGTGVAARVSTLEYAITDRPASGGGTWYRMDRFSLMTYGLMLQRWERDAEGFSWADMFNFYVGPDGGNYAYAAGAGGHGVGVSMAMPVALTSLPTSGSRHYQSPHRVRNDRVYFEIIAAPYGTVAHANIKGRTLDASDQNAPAVDTNVTVGGP